ncbi:hypothetical protein [Shimia sp. MIT910701]|uniref:hypothetical protein n=1 Tax=Shimia sp. MIT910701 TaxID=3096987 RepID=UPI00399AD362
MDDRMEKVRGAFAAAETIENDAPDVSDHREEPRSSPGDLDLGEEGPPMIEDGDGESILPSDFPVQPLGMAAGKFHFLTARGEMAELSAGAMANRANLVALVAGADDPIGHLGSIAEPKGRKDNGFNLAGAADALMQACSALPLYDATMPIRHTGTWRGASGHPIVHKGESIEAPGDESRNGRMISRALYPAVPSRPMPADKPAQADDIAWVRERLQRFWSWAGPTDADVMIGWVGQAALGQYPSWRTHMYVKGKHGSGKTTLTKIVSSLLGGMSTGVKNSTSAAAIRQTTNRQAIARVFDEAEADESGASADVVALFRLMSDAEGAQVERGTADHSGIRFELYGAGYLASVIPAAMTSADRSRFTILNISERESDDDPTMQAMWLEELQQDALELGAGVWRRMLDLAPTRWDKTFRIYNALVQELGARARSGDTIGAILAGWDLMLFDAPLVDPDSGEPDFKRMEQAKAIAQPLVEVSQEAEDEGEGERCLRTIFASLLQKDHGGVTTVAELIELSQTSDDKPPVYENKLLGRLGLRVLPGRPYERELFVANGQNPILDRALAGTRWRNGGHRAALDTIKGVAPSPKPQRVAGRLTRGLIIPARLLPGGKIIEPAGAGDTENDTVEGQA